MIAEDQGKSFDETAFETALTAAVKDVVQRQKNLGIDIVSDGEFSKRASRCMRTNGSRAWNQRARAAITLGNLTGIGLLSRILRR